MILSNILYICMYIIDHYIMKILKGNFYENDYSKKNNIAFFNLKSDLPDLKVFALSSL